MDVRLVAEPHQGAIYVDVLNAALAAAAGGFDGFFTADHLMAFRDVDGLPGPTEAWVTMAGLARETERIRLGTLVSSATFRHPSLLAIQVAQIDHMSGGRIELGLGAGWWPEEHQAFGLYLPDASTRFDRLEEQLDVITRLWGTDERVSFTGKHFSLDACRGLPKPLQKEHPPIIIGGLGRRRTPALAARFADEFNAPYALPDEVAEQFQRVRAACSAIGRDPDDMVYSAAVGVACGRTEDEFAQRAVDGGSTPERYRTRKAGGFPAEVAATIRRYAALGCSRIYLQLPSVHDLDHIQLLAAEVLPLVAGASVPGSALPETDGEVPDRV